MIDVDRDLLAKDLPYRGVYDHLFEFSYTKQTFLVSRDTGYEGDLADSLAKLTVDSEQMKYRKHFLSFWAARILTARYEDMKTFEYLDKVGIMHIGMSAFKHREKKAPLKVDLHVLSLTLGWVMDVVISIVMAFPRSVLGTSAKTDFMRAFNKIMWIQQDLFARHYTRTDEEAEVHLAKLLAEEEEAKKEAAEEAERAKAAKAKALEEEEKISAQEAAAELPEVKV
ncbi:hypothetical protein MNV49_007868 [Pseudohyphozyma bogoriensis]|nr:hypothetical protein MNV49_007868 [Pseudohyphozyma bogoriensis]